MEFLLAYLCFESKTGSVKSGSVEIIKYNASNIFAKLYE